MSTPRTFRALCTPCALRTLCTLSTLVFFLAVSVHATVVVPADLGELARDARTIARGVVVAVESRWVNDRARSIETLVTLRADTYLKGALGETVQFRVPGGRIDRYRAVTVGAPVFEVGQRAVVFLGVRGPGIPYVLGLNQGVFRLVRESNVWVVTPPPINPAFRTTRLVRGDTLRRPMPLNDFEARVRLLAGGTR